MVVLCLITSAILSTVAGATSSATLSYISGGLAAFGALHETLNKLLIEDLTTAKRDQYKEKCRIRRQGLDDLFVICAEAISSGELTVDDLKKYVKSMKDTNEDLGKVSGESKEAMETVQNAIAMMKENVEKTKKAKQGADGVSEQGADGGESAGLGAGSPDTKVQIEGTAGTNPSTGS